MAPEPWTPQTPRHGRRQRAIGVAALLLVNAPHFNRWQATIKDPEVAHRKELRQSPLAVRATVATRAMMRASELGVRFCDAMVAAVAAQMVAPTLIEAITTMTRRSSICQNPSKPRSSP